MRDEPTPALPGAVQHRQPQPLFARKVRSLSTPLRGLFLLLGASSTEVIRQAVISLVTGELKYRALDLHHGKLRFPRSCPGCWIFNREFVEDGVLVDACEAFDHVQVFTGSSEVSLIGEIGCVDDQRIALPAATRVAHQLADVWPQVRTAVQRYDAGVVDLLLENRHVSGTLLKLDIAVVGLGKHGRSLARHQDTTLAQRPAFRSIEGATPFPRLGARRRSLPRLRRQRRNSPIRRIHNQRSSSARCALRLERVQSELKKIIMRFSSGALSRPGLEGLRLFRLLLFSKKLASGKRC